MATAADRIPYSRAQLHHQNNALKLLDEQYDLELASPFDDGATGTFASALGAISRADELLGRIMAEARS